MKKIVITPLSYFYMLKTVIHIIEKYLLRETFCNQVCPDKHTKYCGDIDIVKMPTKTYINLRNYYHKNYQFHL